MKNRAVMVAAKSGHRPLQHQTAAAIKMVIAATSPRIRACRFALRKARKAAARIGSTRGMRRLTNRDGSVSPNDETAEMIACPPHSFAKYGIADRASVLPGAIASGRSNSCRLLL